ncbi:MAG: hypothetical protein ACRELY_31450, partial [Polyangiaceae bacterium]
MALTFAGCAAVAACHGSSHQASQTQTTGSPMPGNDHGNGSGDNHLRAHPVGQVNDTNGNVPAGAAMEPR